MINIKYSELNPKASLHDAFRWRCPECEHEQYNRGIASEELETIFKIECICPPSKVKCKKCNKKFMVDYEGGI